MATKLNKKQSKQPNTNKNVNVDQILKMLQTMNSPVPNVKQVSEKKKSGFLTNILGKASSLAPLANLIPGVGPIASQLLSTLNDDEWFEKYSSSGASFNELLVTRLTTSTGSVNKKGIIDPRAAFAFVTTQINSEKTFLDNFMPSVIAFIREKTNNVLVDDVSKYSDVFVHASNLYAIYYSLEKYTSFAQNQPINVPMLTDLVTIISPKNLNQVIGIRDALKSYLSSTVSLPYAWREAIRWRYGTMFHAFNTGQPGFITYDPVFDGEQMGSNLLSPEMLGFITYEISNHQEMIMSAGRAAADFKLAYTSHQENFSVETPHYDEKEFNLRLNLTTYSSVDRNDQIIELVKDSRLASSPAIQASTLSTNTTLAPFVIMGVEFAHYVFQEDQATQELGYFMREVVDPWGDLQNVINNGWFLADVNDVTVKIGWYSDDGIMKASPQDAAKIARSQFTIALANSLGFEHINQNVQFIDVKTLSGNVNDDSNDSITMKVDKISYDYARINPSTLESIQLSAIRNLTRGDYTRKAVKDDVSQIIEIREETDKILT